MFFVFFLVFGFAWVMTYQVSEKKKKKKILYTRVLIKTKVGSFKILNDLELNND